MTIRPTIVVGWLVLALSATSAAAASPEPVFTVQEKAFNAVFHPDGDVWASAGSGGSVKIHSTETGEIEETLEAHKGNLSCIAFSQDGKLFVTASPDKTIKLWDSKTWKLRGAIPTPGDNLRSLALNDARSHLAVGTVAGEISVWDWKTLTLVRMLPKQDLAINRLVYRPDDGALVCATGNWKEFNKPGTVKLFPAGESEKELTFGTHQAEVKGVTFNRDGSVLATFGSFPTVRTWDPGSGAELPRLGIGAAVAAVAFGQGDVLFAGAVNGKVQVWDYAQGKLLAEHVCHDKMIFALALSPNGERLLSVGHDGVIKQWRVADLTENEAAQ